MQQELTLQEVVKICNKISYKDWYLRIGDDVNSFWIQWVFMEKDVTKPEDDTLYDQFCRKWRISKYSTTTEIIRTAYKAALQAEEHEASERFLYEGVRLFDPHTDYIQLAHYMKNAPQDARNSIQIETE